MAQEMTSAAKREVASPDLAHSTDLARRAGGEAMRAGTLYVPATDIYETADDVVLVADMPGVPTDGVDIDLERRVLTIRGRLPTAPREGYQLVYAEYGEGDYERSFQLSEEIDRDRIEARHKNGVLTLRMPKAASAKARKIAVNVH
jgi:HSP20 family molecular chaperone IbpA